ncbi:NgoMIV family type II restriction endonuclease [Sphingomonas aestuarii]
MTVASLTALRAEFHDRLCDRLLVLSDGVASNADGSQQSSVRIAATIAETLGARDGKKLAGQTAGVEFETAVTAFIQSVFAHLATIRPGEWKTECINARSELVIARYQQYSHLAEVQRITKANPDLAAFVGGDYAVASDIVISRTPLADAAFASSGLALDEISGLRSPLRHRNNAMPLMHASVSCKWTMRSDRAQNSRFEALNLIRSRKGRVPHIVVVTGEPSPSRLASLALGTGDLDCVYHFALPELVQAVEALGQDEVVNLLGMMIEGDRLRDIADLPLDLAS